MMLSYWAEMGLFVGKAVIIVAAIIAIVVVIAGASQKNKGAGGSKGRLSIKHLNHLFKEARNTLRFTTMEKKDLKQLIKTEHKEEKKAKKDKEKKCLYVVDFHGDIKASAAQNLSEEVSAILSVAKPEDEVLVKLESGGGMVHSYGFATAELERLTKKNIRLTVAVDKVAASGGYMMACVADHIIATPFAVIGSIGVMAQLPNVNRLLKKNDIDIELHTAGEYKRTLTMLGENTDKGRTKFLEDLEKTHRLFKAHVSECRQQLDISEVATGEVWYGQEALENKLVDELGTSSEYLFNAVNQGVNVYQVKWETKKKGLMGKLRKGAENTAVKAVDTLWDKITTPTNFL